MGCPELRRSSWALRLGAAYAALRLLADRLLGASLPQDAPLAPSLHFVQPSGVPGLSILLVATEPPFTLRDEEGCRGTAAVVLCGQISIEPGKVKSGTERCRRVTIRCAPSG